MGTLYRYYQINGGEEEWTLTYETDDLAAKKPTFVTALAVDTIISNDTPKELKEKAKYQGDLYFDLDSTDLAESISDARELIGKLKSKGLEDCDIQVYLSGKKGLHITVPQVVFMQKVTPLQGLVAMYKEIAFSLAVGTMDFRVYTAKRGRMFRTTYNVRENGAYKVPITVAELEHLTVESYVALCSAPRVVGGHNPQFRTGLALMFDAAQQKISKLKPKVRKPISPAVLAEQLSLVDAVVNSTKPLQGGFNIVAMQLALYAREAGWTEDQLVNKVEPLLANHVSDGSRYNTRRRREVEIRRMFNYVDDNSGLEYNPSGLKALTGKTMVVNPMGDDEEPDSDAPVFELTAGVTQGRRCYLATRGGDEGDVPITNYVYKSVVKLVDSKGKISTLRLRLVKSDGGFADVDVAPSCFTSSSAQHTFVSAHGGSFTGTDMHARGIYQLMLKEVTATKYVIDTEGINLIRLPNAEGEAAEPFMVWADRNGVVCTNPLFGTDSATTFEFEGYPDPVGVMKTDLLKAHDISAWMADANSKQVFIEQVNHMLHCHTAEVMGKMVGWTVACFYKPLFIDKYTKFPMMHVFGPAGGGKTETTMNILRMFYHRNEPMATTPDSSVFALQSMLAGSESIPLTLDEYKPHRLGTERLEALRAMMRAAYNSKEVQRGGGGKAGDSYRILAKQKLAAPLVFIAEAGETETAIVERSVMVSFRRLTGRQQATAFRHAMEFQTNTDPMGSIGLAIASRVVSSVNIDAAMASFDKLHNWATQRFLPQPDDYEKLDRGELTVEEVQVKTNMRPRNVFNASVACFGLARLKDLLTEVLGEELFTQHFKERFREMSTAVFTGMDTLTLASIPEYAQVLNIMSDMTRMVDTDQYRLIEGVDYNLTEWGGRAAIVLASRLAYRKYRGYMRSVNMASLYPNDIAFELALHDIPQFLKNVAGTDKADAPCVVLDLIELTRAGVLKFKGTPIPVERIIRD